MSSRIIPVLTAAYHEVTEGTKITEIVWLKPIVLFVSFVSS